MLGVFGAAIFSGALLVFLVQPMVARLVLPLFGGTPAVWNTAMLFFQTLLLGGYLYAHLLTTRARARTQVIVHGLVLLAGLAALPIALPMGWEPAGGSTTPIGSVLAALAIAAGVPFFVVSSGGPLLQRWFSGTGHHRSADPYFLYAASNAGSLLGLVGYPLLLEPRATLSQQGWVWSIGYGLFVVTAIGSGVALLVSGRRRQIPASPMVAGVADPGAEAELEDAAEHTERAGVAPSDARGVEWRDRFIWLGLAFVPSTLMLGTTQHITTDLAAVPLLWVIPLAIYLLTFILAFSRVGGMATRVAARAAPILIVAVVVMFLLQARRPLGAIVLTHLAMLSAGAMAFHGALAARRPHASRLTEFYLAMSLGGALGGVFNAIIGPLAFDRILEYPIAIALVGLALPAGEMRGRLGRAIERTLAHRAAIAAVPALLLAWELAIHAGVPVDARVLGVGIHPVLLVGVPAAIAFVTSVRPRVFAGATAALLGFAVFAVSYSTPPEMLKRTFFGVHAVGTTWSHRMLWHGTTLHGMQALAGSRRTEPLAYYHRAGPAGDVFDAIGPRADRVGLIGLGAGALLSYGREGQRFDVFEIDPVVVRIAENPRWFTYLRDTPAEYKVTLGDGRLSLAKRPVATYDLLVLDAFTSDAIPVHLLTREAVELYMSRLDERGVLLVHISNQHLELAPVVAGIARDLGLAASRRHDREFDSEKHPGRFSSDWVAVARTGEVLRDVRSRGGWVPLTPEEGFRTWTDDYSSILTVLEIN